MNSPIIISGTPRAGTTWMQWFLSQHPNIHIHGQEPQLAWSTLFKWHEEMIQASEWGEKSNKSRDVKSYPIPHYAGSDKNRCDEIFRSMVKDFMCGFAPEKPRWGVKALWLCSNQKMVDKINKLWPDTKWIICIRHPFASFESQKNTFVKDMDLDIWIKRWIDSVAFLQQNDGFLIQIDNLSKENYQFKNKQLNKLIKFIKEQPSKETDNFIKQWNIVHKVKPDADRGFKLGEKRKQEMKNKYPQLNQYMQQLNY